MIMLLAPEDLVQGLSGMELLQTAMHYHMGQFGVIFIAATLFMFSFSTFLGILFYARAMWPIFSVITGVHRQDIRCWHW